MAPQSMVPVRVSEIPPYLHGSALHSSLVIDADDEITVPGQCFKLDETVNNEREVVHLLHTLRYWGVSRVPVSIARFYLIDEHAISRKVVKEFGAQFTYIAVLNKIQQGMNVFGAASPMSMAIEHNELDLVKAMHRAGLPWSSSSAAAAATVNNLEILKFVHISGCSWDGRKVAYSAAYNGRIDCLKYTKEQGTTFDEQTLECACESNLDCTKYVCEQVDRTTLSEWLTCSKCETSARTGSLEILKFLRSIGCPWDETTTSGAVKFGHLDCLKYACENGCPITSSAVNEAAGWGYVDIVQYLRECGCSWNEHTCYAAAGCSSPECLMYLHEHGCPWYSDYIMNLAARWGRPASVRYLLEQGCRWTLETARDATASTQYEACLQLLWDCGCPMDETIVKRALSNGNCDCVQYLIDRGCPYDAELSYQPNYKGLVIRDGKCLRGCWK